MLVPWRVTVVSNGASNLEAPPPTLLAFTQLKFAAKFVGPGLYSWGPPSYTISHMKGW